MLRCVWFTFPLLPISFLVYVCHESFYLIDVHEGNSERKREREREREREGERGRERKREREIRRLVIFFIYSISLFNKILNPTSCVTEESLKNHIVLTKHLNTLINLILNLKKTIIIIMK